MSISFRHFCFTNLTADHQSADDAEHLADKTARQLARVLIGPGASEEKEFEVAGVLLDLLIELTRFGNALEENDLIWRIWQG